MARKPRFLSIREPGIYHVILRGNNQQNLFYSDTDRYFFINRLKKYSNELKIDIYAFCLMSNHVHILLGKANKALSLFVQKIANSYVYYFNRKYERTGHLFQGRFKSEAIENDQYFKTVLRYILQNPQKAGISKFETYKWNSYKDFFSNKESVINKEYTYEIFNGKDNAIAFISQTNTDTCMEFENKLLLSDSKAIKFIKKILNISPPEKLIHLDIDLQLEKIYILKTKGLSINQISRLTGISRKIIRIA